MPIKVSFFGMAHDHAPGEADRRDGLRRSKRAGHRTRNTWRAFGRPLMALVSPSSIARCNALSSTEVEGVPRRLTSASGRGANAGFWRGLAVPGPVQSQQPRTAPAAAIFRSARLRSSRGSALRPDSLRGRYRIGLALYSDEGAQPAGFLTQPLQRLPEVPPPPSICWPISAMAR
jgi:hypothetical protein